MVLSLNNKKVFVLHVKKGFEQREEHINKMLGEMNISFEYELGGDVSDLSEEILDKWFVSYMHAFSPQASCFYKHILACKRIIDEELDGALMLEDDICLSKKKFIPIFNQSMMELDVKGNSPAIISYEDTRLRFVPRSQRKRGKVIYVGNKDRMTGAYYINYAAAKLMWDYIETAKYGVPYDIAHYELLKKGMLTYYWSQPAVASQGSHTGKFTSSINFSKKIYYPIAWQFKLAYKKLLYELR